MINRLVEFGKDAIYLKYPIYDLEPTGPIINAALREGLEISDFELQQNFAQNRFDFQPQLEKFLNSGKWPVSEDYSGTGKAWGVVNDISIEEIEEMNADLLKEDLAILLDGERFTSGIEREHRYEIDRDWERARQVHLKLAERYGWEIVNANSSMENVSLDIWNIVFKKLLI